MAFTTRGKLQEPLHYLEGKVRFSFSKCDTNKYSVTALSRAELEKFFARLGHLEKHTWGSLRGVPRESGISIDKKGSEVHELLRSRMVEGSVSGHFRIGGTDANMRAFVGIHEDLAYVLLVDREGRIQH